MLRLSIPFSRSGFAPGMIFPPPEIHPHTFLVTRLRRQAVLPAFPPRGDLSSALTPEEQFCSVQIRVLGRHRRRACAVSHGDAASSLFLCLPGTLSSGRPHDVLHTPGLGSRIRTSLDSISRARAGTVLSFWDLRVRSFPRVWTVFRHHFF